MLLAIGSKGPEVAAVQELLNKIGVSCDVDGDFGAGTQKAVKTFQTAYGIEADGIVGENTLAKLAEAVAAADGAQPAS